MRQRLLILGLALVSCAAPAADTELAELRQQVLQMKQDYEQRIRAFLWSGQAHISLGGESPTPSAFCARIFADLLQPAHD